MERFKNILKLSALVLLIVLASVGIGLGGGVPIPPSNKRKDSTDLKIELVESNEDNIRVGQSDIKQ